MFQIRNKMLVLSSNYSRHQKEICLCGKEEETIKHIYYCKIFKNETTKTEFDEIFSNNIKKQVEVLRRLEICLQRRDEIKTKINCIVNNNCNPSDPNVIHCIYSNG